VKPEPSPRIGPLLLGVTWLEVVILAWAGIGLLVWPPVVLPVWPWPLAPFNQRYLGALYAAALIAAWLQVRSARWSPARVVTTMIFAFTLVVTVYSVVHRERFDPRRIETAVWFGLYVGVCLNAGWHLWRGRAWPLPGAMAPAGGLRGGLLAVSVVLGAYGLALLLAPLAASAFWPWKLDAFHAQLYSVTFLTPAAGAALLVRRATPAELRALGLTLAAWGGLPLLGLGVVDAALRRVDWSSPGTGVWLMLFAAMGAAGCWIARAGREAGR
jgi:hypothetical protein